MLAERRKFLIQGYWKILFTFIIASVIGLTLITIFYREALTKFLFAITALLPIFVVLYAGMSLEVLYVFKYRAKNDSLKRFKPTQLGNIALIWTLFLTIVTVSMAIWAIIEVGTNIGPIFLVGEILAALGCYDLYNSSKKLREY